MNARQPCKRRRIPLLSQRGCFMAVPPGLLQRFGRPDPPRNPADGLIPPDGERQGQGGYSPNPRRQQEGGTMKKG
ncbi:hypothetical protein LX36DRAFT_246769 [Colletotrichum falcatum]|nr:hypothetical protein LX36DRAFT_246769 [Colletotrichum falcatum]